MNILKEADFRRQIKAAPEKCYLFYGDEEYMKNYSLTLAKQTLCPDETLAFFNEIKLDSISYSPSALLDAIMPAPMMADKKLISIQGVDFKAMKQNEVDELCSVLDMLDEYDYNTVIIVTMADKFDAGRSPKSPSTTLQKLSERAVCVNFEKNTPAKLSAWLAKHFEHNGVSVTPDVCMALIDRCGRDMYTLANETDKLSYYALSQGRNAVTREDVVKVAIAATEYDAFAFTNAIAARRREEALGILYDMKSRRIDPIIIMAEVSKTACDIMSISTLMREGLTAAEISRAVGMHEFPVTKIMNAQISDSVCRHMINACTDADLQIKSFSDGYSVIERLICTI